MMTEGMTTITPPEETDLEIDGAQETEAIGDAVVIEVENIIQDATTRVSEIEDVAMSLRSQRSGNEMTADLGLPAENLAMHPER